MFIDHSAPSTTLCCMFFNDNFTFPAQMIAYGETPDPGVLEWKDKLGLLDPHAWEFALGNRMTRLATATAVEKLPCRETRSHVAMCGAEQSYVGAETLVSRARWPGQRGEGDRKTVTRQGEGRTRGWRCGESGWALEAAPGLTCGPQGLLLASWPQVTQGCLCSSQTEEPNPK